LGEIWANYWKTRDFGQKQGSFVYFLVVNDVGEDKEDTRPESGFCCRENPKKGFKKTTTFFVTSLQGK
jgi:hypothetical protein